MIHFQIHYCSTGIDDDEDEEEDDDEDLADWREDEDKDEDDDEGIIYVNHVE